ncbi:helix-turn-helix transcriptional regulator [Niallia sp. 03133]|uniref:helix-turn-helix transcriptional regulator n=1 Tax=Niallia sp. 03133 TaxID=3458060 RepID=UPI0040439B1E
MNKVERLFKIIDYLSVGDFVNAKELAHITKTSIRNIYRDISELEKVGFYFHSEKKGYLLIEKPINQNTGLTDREWLSLLLTQALPKQYVIKENSKKIEYKFERNKMDKEIRWNQVVSNHILHHFLYHDTYDENLMIALVNAMEKNRNVLITYYSPANAAETKRIIHPYYIIDRDDHYYVVAYCNERKEIRNFRIDRIRNWQLQKENFIVQNDFSIANHLAAWKMDSTDEINKFVIRFSNKSRKIYKRKKVL